MSDQMDEIQTALLGSARAAILHETVAILALDPSSRLLTFLRKKAPVGWTIPAGHWEKNESALDAAVREMHEEIGLQVSPERMQPLGEFMPAHDRPIACRRSSLTTHRDHVFLILLKEKEISRIEPGDEVNEKAPLLWIPIDEIPSDKDHEPSEKLTVGTFFILNQPCIRSELRAIAAKAGLRPA